MAQVSWDTGFAPQFAEQKTVTPKSNKSLNRHLDLEQAPGALDRMMLRHSQFYIRSQAAS